MELSLKIQPHPQGAFFFGGGAPPPKPGKSALGARLSETSLGFLPGSYKWVAISDPQKVLHSGRVY